MVQVFDMARAKRLPPFGWQVPKPRRIECHYSDEFLLLIIYAAQDPFGSMHARGVERYEIPWRVLTHVIDWLMAEIEAGTWVTYPSLLGWCALREIPDD